MMRKTIQRFVLVGLLCCVPSGCAAERRREVRQKAADLKTQVELLQQRVDAQADLKKILTLRQEAALVELGQLD